METTTIIMIISVTLLILSFLALMIWVKQQFEVTGELKGKTIINEISNWTGYPDILKKNFKNFQIECILVSKLSGVLITQVRYYREGKHFLFIANVSIIAWDDDEILEPLIEEEYTDHIGAI